MPDTLKISPESTTKKNNQETAKIDIEEKETATAKKESTSKIDILETTERQKEYNKEITTEGMILFYDKIQS